MGADKASDPTTRKAKGKPSKAGIAIAKIRTLYLIEDAIRECSDDEKYHKRQELSVPSLEEFKAWLDKNVAKVMKGSQTRMAKEYTLNQWKYLIGYYVTGI